MSGPAIRLPLPIERRTVSKEVLDSSKLDDTISDGSTTASSSTSRLSVSGDEYGLTSPVNWRVRNTFLEAPLLKPTLLQGFQRSRRAWSVPAEGREAAEREAVAAEVSAWSSASSSSSGEGAELEPEVVGRKYEEELQAAAAASAPRPLILAELVSPMAPRGSSSQGSALHYQGTCKPCAFFWKVVGCKYGTECEFCHLCDADERKRRNKEKRVAMHAFQARSDLAASGGKCCRGSSGQADGRSRN